MAHTASLHFHISAESVQAVYAVHNAKYRLYQNVFIPII